MSNILFVSTSLKIHQTLSRYFKDRRLDQKKTFVVIEFFGKDIPTELPYNYLGVSDLLNQKELDDVCERLQSYGRFSTVISLSELTIYAAADFRRRLGTLGPSKEFLERFRDKIVMKRALDGSGIRVPRVYSSTSLSEGHVQFPLIAKPRAYCGSMGVRIVRTEDDLQEIISRSSEPANPNYDGRFVELREGDLQFEEFILGDTYHVDGLVRNGVILLSKTYRHINSCLEFIRGCPLGNISIVNPREIEEWTGFANRVIKAMKVPDGAFHLEAFLTPNGEPIFLEIAVRPPGGMISNTLDQVHGIDLRWEHISAQLKLPYCESFFANLKRQTIQSGDLIFPMNYIPEGQTATRFVESVSELYPGDYPTLYQAKYPQVGSPAESDFAYENNLGSFIFASSDVNAINMDINKVIQSYRVRILT